MPQPVEMNKIGKGVLEARFQVLTPPDIIKWATAVQLMDQEDDQTLFRIQINHNPGRNDEVILKCSSNTTTAILGQNAITTMALQNFLQLRVWCAHLYYDRVKNSTFRLSFSNFKWASHKYNFKVDYRSVNLFINTY